MAIDKATHVPCRVAVRARQTSDDGPTMFAHRLRAMAKHAQTAHGIPGWSGGARGPDLALIRGMYRSASLCLILTACATTSVNEKAGPRGLRADQHLSAASREEEHAAQLARWPDTRPGADGTTVDQQQAAGTWFGTWDTATEHRRLAQIHRSAAAALQAEYEQACEDTPPDLVSVSPLQRYGISGTRTDDGVLVLLSASAGPPDRLLAAMRCHRAWMMLGRTDMDDCPLDLPGIQVSARGDADGIELTISVPDRTLVPELQRRAAHDLEVKRHEGTAGDHH